MLGYFHSHPGPHAARGPHVGHPCYIIGMACEIADKLIKVRVCVDIPGQIYCLEAPLGRFHLRGWEQVICFGISQVGSAVGYFLFW